MPNNSQASRTWRKRYNDGQSTQPSASSYKKSKKSKKSKQRGGYKGGLEPVPGPRKFDCLPKKQRMWHPFWEDPLMSSVAAYGFNMNTLIAKVLEYGEAVVRRAIANVESRWQGRDTYRIDGRKIKELHEEIREQAMRQQSQQQLHQAEGVTVKTDLDAAWMLVCESLLALARSAKLEPLQRAVVRILAVKWVSADRLVIAVEGRHQWEIARRRPFIEAGLTRHLGREVAVEVLAEWEYQDRYGGGS